jgi:TorA maturation chaperone TorD
MSVMTQSIQRELESFFIARKNVYQLLHFLFQEPVYHAALLEVRDSGNISELAEIHEGGKILSRFFSNLKKQQIKNEHEEYQRLFLGPGPICAPPWESFYRSKEHLLFEEWTYQVRKEYHRYGLTFIRENNEPDDHLLLELEYMIFLVNACLKGMETVSLRVLIEDQILFIENHLMAWIPLFCQRVIDHSNSQLYTGAAMLLTDFLDFDLDTLHEVKEALTDVGK